MKAKLFVGTPETGKTRLAREISEKVGKENTVFLDMKSVRKGRYSPYLFRYVNENTKLIVFDDCPKGFDYNMIFSMITMIDGEIKAKIWVEKRGELPKEIVVDQIIFTTNHFPEEKYKGMSFDARCDVVRFDENTWEKISDQIEIEMLDDQSQHFDFEKLFSNLTK